MTKTKKFTKKDSRYVDKIEPVLMFTILCDNVDLDTNKKKRSIVGIFDSIHGMGPIDFHIATGWTLGKGEFYQTIRIKDPDLKIIFESERSPIKLKDKIRGCNVDFRFIAYRFPSPGVYWFEILLNGKRKRSFPVPVHSE